LNTVKNTVIKKSSEYNKELQKPHIDTIIVKKLMLNLSVTSQLIPVSYEL